MDMQAVLKAGGVGAGITFVLSLLGLIPCVGCLTFILSLAAYVGVGVLAAYWMILPRTAGSGAMNGAAAAVIAALVGGLVNAIVVAISFSIGGASQLSQIPPEQLQALAEAGIDPTIFTSMAGIIGISAFCCAIGLFLAAALGAAGGAFWGSNHPN